MGSSTGVVPQTPMFVTQAVRTGTAQDGSPVYGAGQPTYQLANNQTLAAGGTTAAVAGITGGSYIWSYQFSGTSPSLILEALGPDGTNYQTIATVTQSGTQGVVLGQGSTVRLRNAGANQITGLYSSLT